MQTILVLCFCCLCTVITAADDVVPAGAGLHPTWAEVRNARWPGEPAQLEEFGPAVDGVRLAARVLPISDPNGDEIAVAVTVWNNNEAPMSFYGFGWSAEVLPIGKAPRSNAQRIGGPRPTWYGTVTMQAHERLSYVVVADVDDNARLTEKQQIKLEFHHVPGIEKWAPGKVIPQGFLLSAPIQCAWPQRMDPALVEAYSMLNDVLQGNEAKLPAFLEHPQAVAACELALLSSSIR